MYQVTFSLCHRHCKLYPYVQPMTRQLSLDCRCCPLDYRNDWGDCVLGLIHWSIEKKKEGKDNCRHIEFFSSSFSYPILYSPSNLNPSSVLTITTHFFPGEQAVGSSYYPSSLSAKDLPHIEVITPEVLKQNSKFFLFYPQSSFFRKIEQAFLLLPV